MKKMSQILTVTTHAANTTQLEETNALRINTTQPDRQTLFLFFERERCFLNLLLFLSICLFLL